MLRCQYPRVETGTRRQDLIFGSNYIGTEACLDRSLGKASGTKISQRCMNSFAVVFGGSQMTGNGS